MKKYVISTDEINPIEVVCEDFNEAVKQYDEIVKVYNKKYNTDVMTSKEMLEECPEGKGLEYVFSGGFDGVYFEIIEE